MKEPTWMYRTKDGEVEAQLFDFAQHGIKAKLKRDGWRDHPKEAPKSETKKSKYASSK